MHACILLHFYSLPVPLIAFCNNGKLETSSPFRSNSYNNTASSSAFPSQLSRPPWYPTWCSRTCRQCFRNSKSFLRSIATWGLWCSIFPNLITSISTKLLDYHIITSKHYHLSLRQSMYALYHGFSFETPIMMFWRHIQGIAVTDQFCWRQLINTLVPLINVAVYPQWLVY